jgi:hypothetical protein
MAEDIPAALENLAVARGLIIEAAATPPNTKEREDMIVKAVVHLALAVGKLVTKAGD